MEQPEFGKKLFELRRVNGLTQDELAVKCNITVRTIQRLESGTVNPRTFTLKVLSEALGYDFFEISKTGIDVKINQGSNMEWFHNILCHLKDLFNLKTKTMKKVSILSIIFFLISIGLFALIPEKVKINPEVVKKNNIKGQDSLPIGFYVQIVDNDTTFYGLITENTQGIDLDNIFKLASDFGVKLEIMEISTKKSKLIGMKPCIYPFQDSLIPIYASVLNTLDLIYTIPHFNYKERYRFLIGPDNNPLVGFYFNKQYKTPISMGELDKQYFTDYYDLQKVITKFSDTKNLNILLNGKTVNKNEYKRLMNYEMVKFESVRSVIVTKKMDNCEICIKTI